MEERAAVNGQLGSMGESQTEMLSGPMSERSRVSFSLGLLDSPGGVWVVILTLTGGKPDALHARTDTIAQRWNVALHTDIGERPVYHYVCLTTKFIFHVKTKYVLA